MKVNSTVLSNTSNIVSGVPQGLIRGPLLFNSNLLTQFLKLFAHANNAILYDIVSTEILVLLSATSLFKEVEMRYRFNCF